MRQYFRKLQGLVREGHTLITQLTILYSNCTWIFALGIGELVWKWVW